MHNEELVQLIHTNKGISSDIIEISKEVYQEPLWPEVLFRLNNCSEINEIITSKNRSTIDRAFYAAKSRIQNNWREPHLKSGAFRLLSAIRNHSLTEIEKQGDKNAIKREMEAEVEIRKSLKTIKNHKRGVSLESQLQRELSLRRRNPNKRIHRNRKSKKVPCLNNSAWALLIAMASIAGGYAWHRAGMPLPSLNIMTKEEMFSKLRSHGIDVKYEPECQVIEGAIGHYTPDKNMICMKESSYYVYSRQDELRTLTHEAVHAIQDCNNPGKTYTALHNYELTPLGKLFNAHKFNPDIQAARPNWKRLRDPIEREADGLEKHPHLVFNEILPSICGIQ